MNTSAPQRQPLELLRRRRRSDGCRRGRLKRGCRCSCPRSESAQPAARSTLLRPLQEPAAPVEAPDTLYSRRTADGSRPAATAASSMILFIAASSSGAAYETARQPPVRQPPGQREHPRLVRAQPDLHIVRRLRPALGPRDRVVLARKADPATLGVQTSRMIAIASSNALDALPRRQLRPSVGCDRLQEPARPQAELNPPTGDQVERRHAASQYDRMTHRQVRHVGGDLHGLRVRGDDRQQRPRVEQPRLVRMVLQGDQVEPDLFGQLRQRDTRSGFSTAGVRNVPKTSSCP